MEADLKSLPTTVPPLLGRQALKNWSHRHPPPPQGTGTGTAQVRRLD